MIKEGTKEIRVKKENVLVHYETESRRTFTCSDGRIFLDEPTRPGYKSMQEQARDHQAGLDRDANIKKELKWHLISGSEWRDDYATNEGYDYKFCFYFSKALPKDIIDSMHCVIYDARHSKWSDMPDGWYICEQRVYEVPSNSRNCEYECEGFVVLLKDHVAEKSREYNESLELFAELAG